jgi:hypothetical protein
MKVTVDLPHELVRELKLRTLNEERKLKDVVAEIIRAGPRRPVKSFKRKPIVTRKDKRTGLTVIVGPKVPRTVALTPDQISQILLDQEVERALGAGR